MLADRETARGTDQPALGHPLTGLGLCRIRAGDIDGAQTVLERAVAVLEPAPRHASALARARFALAVALRKAERDPDRVEELIELARDAFSEDVRDHAAILEELAQFTAGRDLVDLTY